MAWTKQELAEAVMDHAEAHYNDGGWDVVAECWEEKDIIAAIGGARTPQGAIAKVAEVASIFADREADAANSAF